MYLTPSSSKSTQFKLFRSLTHIYKNIRQKYVSHGFLILGDFNKWKYALSFSKTVNLVQLINFPTFVNENRNSSSKLDLIFSDVNKWYDNPKKLMPLKTNATYHVCVQLKPCFTI